MVNDCASDSPEQGDPANMAKPLSADSSLLEALPNELLREIFEQLFYDEDHQAALQNLCLVSKRICPLARPVLFKTISIRSANKLMRLYSILADNEHLGANIREIELTINPDEATRLDQTGLENLRGCYYQHTGEFWDEELDCKAKECNLICILCYKLLARAVNLLSLILDIKIDYTFRRLLDPEDNERRGLLLRQNHSTSFDLVSRATRPAVNGEAAVFLPRLKSLMLGSCSFSFETLDIFLDLPSLNTVRTFDDDGNWWRLAPRAELHTPWPQLFGGRRARQNITTLELIDTEVCYLDVEDIAQLFPYLEVLSLESSGQRSIVHRLKHYIKHGSRRDLSAALGKLTALRVLDITMFIDCDIDEDLCNDIGVTLGPANVLSLAQLPNLQHIEVPMYMLVHLHPSRSEQKAAIPREVLPQALRTLVLRMEHECDSYYVRGKCCRDFMDEALEFLESFGDDLPYFPNLQSVLCSFHYGDYWGPPFTLPSYFISTQVHEEDDTFTCPRLRAIFASFSKQNVEFSFSVY